MFIEVEIAAVWPSIESVPDRKTAPKPWDYMEVVNDGFIDLRDIESGELVDSRDMDHGKPRRMLCWQLITKRRGMVFCVWLPESCDLMRMVDEAQGGK